MLYIIKNKDLRYYYLKELLETKFDVYYDNLIPSNQEIDILFITLEGIDQYGYIKNTNILLEDILKNNKVKKICTGYINNVLIRLKEKYYFEIICLNDNLWYKEYDLRLKANVIEFFLMSSLEKNISDINILVLEEYDLNDNFIKHLNCDYISIKNISDVHVWDKYDAVINFTNYDLKEKFDRIIILMKELKDIELIQLLGNKRIYFINHLLRQYLTKSSAKLLYDCMVKF